MIGYKVEIVQLYNGVKKMKTILHLCADIGSDSKPYKDAGYNVILIGKDIGVENYNPPKGVYGVIANPVCTEFSIARGYHKVGNLEQGMFLVKHCQRIIKACQPHFWVIENPATGKLKDLLGRPDFTYEPWEFGSPYTKKTALWGNFNAPNRLYERWEDVTKNKNLYIRPTRKKPSMAFLHKSAIEQLPEFHCFREYIKDDMSFRSLCNQNFAKAFFEVNQ
jgi:hypothetical protein